MSSFLYRLGRAAVRGRVFVLGAWLALAAVVGGGGLLFQQDFDDSFTIPGSESQEAMDHLGNVFPEMGGGAQGQLILVVPEGEQVDTAANQEAVDTAVGELEEIDQVATVADPFDDTVAESVSDDGQAALIEVQLDVGLGDVTDATTTEMTTVADELRAEAGVGADVHVAGEAFEELVPEFGVLEGAGVGIALVVLLVVFRSVFAAGMPVGTAILGVGVSVGLIGLTTLLTPISSTAPMLAAMLGLALGIDYALFILSRHRDQLAEGADVEDSIARAVATAGSAVAFAGVTNMVALFALVVVGIPFLSAMGIAAAGAITVAVLVVVTLLPALLGFVGERLRPRSGRRKAVEGQTEQSGERVGLARRWVRMATKAPVVTILVLIGGLGAVSIPAASLQLALPDAAAEAEGSPAREGHEAISEHFGPGFNGPLLVIADIIGSHEPVEDVDAIAEDIEQLDGVESVPLATPNPDADTGVIQVVPTSGPDTEQTEQLVETLRGLEQHFVDTYGIDTAVTGLTAVAIDVSDQLGSALVPYGVVVVGLCLVLLAMVFRSIWVPVTASAGYLLSIGAAFGVTVLVFQDGYFAEALNVTDVGTVISFLPIMVMGLLFGLAMDYQVFVVSRIREDYVHGGDAQRAIETGFASASRVVVAAALIMFAVFAGFVPDGIPAIQEIAFSLAVGVFVDAFLVRMTLIPAILALLGERAWRLPRWLDRKLPAFDAEGAALEHELRLADWPSPGSSELVSARQLSLVDDRGRTVYSGVDLHLQPGEVLAISGSEPSGKTALLYSIAGRVPYVQGDLKVLGRVIPQHARAVRTRVALIPCRETTEPFDEALAALSDGISLVLFDDLDAVVNTEQRESLRLLLANPCAQDGSCAAVAFTCQDSNLVIDMVPEHRLSALNLTVTPTRRLAEVR